MEHKLHTTYPCSETPTIEEIGPKRWLVGYLTLDNDPESPREWDNMGTMICWHSKHNLGDPHDHQDSFNLFEKIVMDNDPQWANKEESLGPEKYREWIKDTYSNHVFILPLYTYAHRGLSMRTSPFTCPWDSGQAGWIYMTKKEARASWSLEGQELKDHALEVLRGEVRTYDQYLQGDVYGIIIESAINLGDEARPVWIPDPKGSPLESCFGVFGHEYAKKELKAEMEGWKKHLLEVEEEKKTQGKAWTTPTPEEIKDARVALNMVQGQAADIVGVTHRSWYRYEAGERRMPPQFWRLWNILTEKLQ